MPEGYETETERVRKRLRKTLTPGEKLANFWDYNRKYVLFGLAAALVLAVLILPATGTPKADYTVCWVSALEPDTGTVDEITGALAQFGRDLNGDGQVRVELHRVTVDLGAILENGPQGEKDQANLMALEADLNIFQSGVFLTDDPAALQAWTGALWYRDSSAPDAGAEDWENMFVPWRELPWLGEPPADTEIYLAGRGVWNEKQRDKWAQCWEFWRAIDTNLQLEVHSVTVQKM